MKFALPGQLKGPECKRVIEQAIAIRKKLEPWFASIDGTEMTELAIILRVDGSLGSFGPEVVANIAVEGGSIECDVVVADQMWANRQDEEIASIIRTRVLEAVGACLTTAGISYDLRSLETAGE